MEFQILIESGFRFQSVLVYGFCCGFRYVLIFRGRKETTMRKAWVGDMAREFKVTKGHELFKLPNPEKLYRTGIKEFCDEIARKGRGMKRKR